MAFCLKKCVTEGFLSLENPHNFTGKICGYEFIII